MERYNRQSLYSSFAFSYNLPCEITIKENVKIKQKKGHLNVFARRCRNKSNTVNLVADKNSFQRTFFKEKHTEFMRIKDFSLKPYDKKIKIGTKSESKALNCCQIS